MLSIHLGEYLWAWYQCDHQRIENFSLYQRDHSSLAQFCRYVLYEVQLIVIYLLTAFVFTWMADKTRPIDWFTIFRWLIEASLAPYTTVYIIGVDLDLWDSYSVDFTLHWISSLIYMMKGSLFVWMRYVELHPSSTLNKYQRFFSYRLCNEFGLHHVPDNHLLR